MKFQQGIVITGHLLTGEQLADVFTKVFSWNRVHYIGIRLGMRGAFEVVLLARNERNCAGLVLFVLHL